MLSTLCSETGRTVTDSYKNKLMRTNLSASDQPDRSNLSQHCHPRRWKSARRVTDWGICQHDQQRPQTTAEQTPHCNQRTNSIYTPPLSCISYNSCWKNLDQLTPTLASTQKLIGDVLFEMSKVLHKLYALLGMSQERTAEGAKNKQALQMQGHPHVAQLNTTHNTHRWWGVSRKLFANRFKRTLTCSNSYKM